MRIIKLFTGLAGTIAVLAAVPVLATGVALFSWAGTDDRASLPTVSITSPERAVVADDIQVFVGDRHRYLPTPVHAGLVAHDDAALFVGIGPADEVGAFLADDHAIPGDQAFWTVTDDGTTAAVDWDLESGRWAAVVMNADGSPGVDATVSTSIPAAPLRIAGIVLAILGLGIGSTGAILIAAAWGGRNGRTVAAAPATT